MPMVSSTSETKGMATAVRSMQSREKTKAMISCRMVPGTTSTQKPTRKSLWCAGAIVERDIVKVIGLRVWFALGLGARVNRSR